MNHTYEQVKAMSNHEANIAVAEKLGLNYRADEFGVFVSRKHAGENVISIEGVFNPCENWNDVMPIAQKYKIGITIDWLSASHHTGVRIYDTLIDGFIESQNKNMKRAICEVFLMMDV